MNGWTCHCGAYDLQGVRCPYCGRQAWWYDPPEPFVLPPRRGLGRAGVVLLVLVVAVLGTGLGRVDAVNDGRARARAAALAAVVHELSGYVAGALGAPFHRPVEARLLGGRAFTNALFESEGWYDTEGPADFGATMEALGMADPGDVALVGDDQAFADDVLGFYDTGSKRLYVRGRSLTPFVRLTLVHELVHAWQDQHYGLTGLGDAVTNTDQAIAVKALIEGHASRVEEQWRAAQSATDRASIDAAEAMLGTVEDPTRGQRSLGALYQFPYAVGEEFATALADRGKLTDAYRQPPLSTEQVLHPEAFFREEQPVAMDPPAADGHVVDTGVLGELGLILLLSRGEPAAGAADEARGWAGDAYVTWEDDGTVCTDALVRMDTVAARDRLVTRLRRQGGVGTVIPTDGTALELRSCVTPPA